MLQFPPDFVWGTATSSYQVEGAVDADGRGPSIWDTFCRVPGAVVGGDTGDVACDHYHRWEEDLDLLAWLGVDAYRFSIAWPRVVPDGDGAVNRRGLDFYRRLVDGLGERGISAYPTLYHWDLPQALQDRGGWASRGTVDAFVRYAEVVAGALPDVRAWATLNEPWCSAFLGHRSGRHAPGIRDESAAVAAGHHLLLAHGRAVPAIRAVTPGADVGIVLNLAPVRSLDGDPADVDAVRRSDGGRNRCWTDPIFAGAYPEDVLRDWAPVADLSVVRDGDLDEIAAPIDWLGINYYHPMYVQATGDPADATAEPGTAGIRDVVPAAGERTAMGWPVDATGLEDVLLDVHRRHGPLPILVTENGAAFDDRVASGGIVDDGDREAFVAEHLRRAHALIAAGVDLRGWFVWSFLDNFEWAEGYAKRFGIVHVDYETQVRTPKRSAHWYRDVIGTGGVPDA